MWAHQSEAEYVKAHLSRRCENAPKNQTADEMDHASSSMSDLINGPNLLHGAPRDEEPVNQIYFYGVSFTETSMQKFVQIQLLVSCFYVSELRFTKLNSILRIFFSTAPPPFIPSTFKLIHTRLEFSWSRIYINTWRATKARLCPQTRGSSCRWVRCC
jgi:hypothetical protein